MVTGQQAFPGSTSAVIFNGILTKAPVSPVRLNPDCPAELELIINKMLEKECRLRYQSAKEILVDLQRLRRSLISGPQAKSAQAPERASIVVLPFEDISPGHDNEYFADGLTEELIAELSGVRSLRVISRTSAMLLKGSKKGVPAIARELNVRYVLEGSVRRAGNNLRITAQLIDALHDAHLWADRYSGTLDDIFELQERLARRIVEALRVTLTPSEDRQLTARATQDPRVYDTWVRARQEWQRFSKEAFERGARLLNDALSVVGDNALLYAALGRFYYQAYDFGFHYEKDTMLKTERYAARALELDPALSEGHFAMGLARFKRGDFQGCARHITRAMDLEPNGDGLSFLVVLFCFVGKMAEARRYADEALRLDPLTYMPRWASALVDLFNGHPDVALAQLQDTERKLASGIAFVSWWLAQAAAFAGQEDTACEAFARVAAMEVGIISDMSELSRRALLHDRAGVKEVLERSILQEITKTDEWFPCLVASALTRVGEIDEALFMLERAVSWGFSNYKFLAQHDRFLFPLCGHPRFEALIARARAKLKAFEL